MYYLGIDLGGTNIAAGIVNEKMELIYKTSIPTESKTGEDNIIGRMAKVAKMAIKGAGIREDEVIHIGVGSPGAIDSVNGVVVGAENLGLVRTEMAKKLGAYFPGKPVYLGNDANVAAWAEFKCGAAKGAKDAIMVTLGTGVGGGIITDGKLYTGFNDIGGELGHTVIQMGGRTCGCGRKGCWEAYASVSGLIKTTKEYMEKYPDSLMWKISDSLDKVNGLTSFEAMRKGDEAAQKVVDEYLYAVAVGIIDMINIFQPEIICIGGGISKEGNYLLDPIKKHVEAEAYGGGVPNHPTLKIAELGNDAGIIGAALLGT